MAKQKEDKAGDKTDSSREKPILVSVDTSDEELIELDQKDAFVVFETEAGKFKSLSKEILDQLSRTTRRAYFIAENIMANNGAIGQTPSFVVGTGGPIDAQYDSIKLRRDDMVPRTSRRDKVYKRLQVGWKIASPSDVEYATARLEEGHFETKDPKTGETDQIVMVMPRAQYNELYERSRASRQQIVSGIMDAHASETQDSTGYKTKPVEETRVPFNGPED